MIKDKKKLKEQSWFFINEIKNEKNGLYKLCGENGSGKTTLLENILFTKNSLESDDVAYVSQEIYSYNTRIKDYIKKFNSKINDEEIHMLMESFNLSNIHLNRNFETLSGGEKVKVSLVAALLKNTQYLFLDEPTNNLDSETTLFLRNKIEELSEFRTIVYISHDPRFIFEKGKEINIDDVRINSYLEQNRGGKPSLKEGGKVNDIKFNPFKMAISFLKNKSNIAVILSILSLSLYAAWDLNSNLSIKLANGNPQNLSDDIIYTYRMQSDFNEDNRNFIEYYGLDIPQSNENNNIKYSDLNMILEQSGVNRILLQDEEIFDYAMHAMYEDTLLEELIVLGIPNYFTIDIDFIEYPFAMRSLIEGRLPKDNNYEVALSKNLLVKFFGYTEDVVANAIGDLIEINGVEHQVVGFSVDDIAYISFNSDWNFGFFEMNGKNISEAEEFIKNAMDYAIEHEFIFPDGLLNTIIYLNEGYENEVLEFLITNYPAEHYASSEFILVWEYLFNQEAMTGVILRNLALVLLPTIFIFFFDKKLYINNYNRIKDYQNYYLSKKKVNVSFTIYYLIKYVFIFLLTVFAATYSPYSSYMLPIISLNIFIFATPNLLFLAYKEFKFNKKKIK